MKTEVVKIKNPQSLNLIFGQSHFIKSVEDIHECLVNSVPGALFGLAFCEASSDCLIRFSGTDKKLIKLAVENLKKIACGHVFLIFLKNCFPINVLPRLKQVPELCHIFCATANPVEVIIAETGQGRGVLGVIDGSKPKGVEDQKKIKERKQFLRKIGYKEA